MLKQSLQSDERLQLLCAGGGEGGSGSNNMTPSLPLSLRERKRR
jgi:hypothetical protein